MDQISKFRLKKMKNQRDFIYLDASLTIFYFIFSVRPSVCLMLVAMWILFGFIFMVVSVQPTRLLRKVGGYERMLARLAPESTKMALSHGSLFVLKGAVPDEQLLKSIKLLLKRYRNSMTRLFDLNLINLSQMF